MNNPSTPGSFIPKAVGASASRPMRRPSGLLLVISIVILVASAVLLGGTYAYKKALASRVQTLEETMRREEQNLPLGEIQLFQNFDNKLRTAKDLIEKHIAILPVFRMLEELTLPTIGYSRFTYTPQSISVEGRATNYEDVAAQSQVFSAERGRIQSFMFSDLDLDAQGNVVFKLTIIPDPSLTSFLKNRPSS